MTDVLVVDDDAFTRQGVCAYLESLQFGVGQAGDAAMGWQMAPAQVQTGRTCLPQAGVNRVVVDTAVKTHIGHDELPWVENALQQIPQLTPREREIAWLMAASYTPEGIAQRLYLAKGSVENHITQIYRKLGLADMREEEVGLRPLPVLVKACLLDDIRQG